ncbi:hypothetical protein C8F04DRAFT_1125030 [Mycena alexandri]|uniref:MYND-type domain-containing protein n=1 Tax=Mycena alexandri TaxID=1745969 RepID=A0AAD6SGU4_9AGAR|nr:hypothetical protein C8F04DRAFT_1125030 [Mycena alexandri]
MSLEEEDFAALGLTGPFRELRMKLWGVTQILSTFLRLPEHSPLCAASVAKTITHLLPDDEDIKLRIRLLRTDQRACLDGLVRFITVPRTDEQLQHLETMLNECRCDLTIPLLQLIHDSDNHLGDQLLSFTGLVSSIFETLGNVVLNGLKIGHVGGAMSASDNDSMTKKWPATTAALFPAGPEAAVLNFARLFKLTKSLAILDFTRILLRHCPSLALQISDCILFWEVMIEELQVAADNYCVPDDDQEPHAQSPHQTVRAFAMFLQEFVATFIGGICQKTTSSSLHSFGRKIYDLLLRVLLVAKSSPNQAKLETFCLFVAGAAGVTVKAVPHNQRPRRIHPVVLLYANLGNQPRAWAFTEVFSSISRITAVVKYCSATCTETSESSTQRLRYCARCKVMRYCSNSCQKAAWRYHKNVCVDLERLNEKVLPLFKSSLSIDDGGAGQILTRFEREARKHGFTEDRMKEISAELTPFCHFQNAGSTSAPSHEDANHY